MAVEPEELREVATDFYRDLLTTDPLVETQSVCRQQVWEHIQRRVTDPMRASLAQPFSAAELRDALRALPRDSCPGEDGLAPVFFLQYWDMLGEDLCRCMQYIVDHGRMPQSFGAGLIFLIPKGEGVSEDIRKWRPITILNTVYKILAKAISLRIQPLLGELIHHTQAGFVKERSILDNIFTFWEATALAKLRHEEMAVLLLDFEKAYDRVDWSFLEGRSNGSEEWLPSTVPLAVRC